MPAAFFILIACQVVGESLRQLLHIPVPGPVIGLFLLAAGLVIRRSRATVRPDAPSAHDRTAGAMLTAMGVLLVPAGVGVVTELGLLRDQWLPIVGALVGSTLLGLMVTGVVMHRLSLSAPVPADLQP